MHCPPAQLSGAALERAAGCLEEAFPDCRQGAFFLQFGPGFEVEGLFSTAPSCLPLAVLPDMPQQHTPDRQLPQLLWGPCQGIKILVLQGHRHPGEGLGVYPCLLPLAAAWKLGLRRQIFIDSCISLKPELKAGSWAVLTDFLNGYSGSPLDGLAELLPDPYPDLSTALAQELNSELVNALDAVGISPKLCTYQAQPGFHICTRAEAELARTHGAEILGSDLVLEIITAHAFGCQVAAMALVGAQNAGLSSRRIQRQDILETCRFCSRDFLRGLALALNNIAGQGSPSLQANLPAATADELIQASITYKSDKKQPLQPLFRP